MTKSVPHAPRAMAMLAAGVVVGAGALMVSSPAGAQESGGGLRAPTSQPGARYATAVNLEREMSTMGRTFRRLQSQIKDKSQNESTLTLIAQFEASALASKGAVPPAIAKLAEADRARQLHDYRNMMVNLLQQTLDLEEQVLAGDNVKAADTLATMDEIQKQGHKEFRGAEGRGG